MPNPMREFCVAAIAELRTLQAPVWAERWVALRMDFCRKFQVEDNLITSTTHGSDFFTNVLNGLDGEDWSKHEHKGIYEDNFRRLIDKGRKMDVK